MICDEDCAARFTCSLCGTEKNLCWYRVGGFSAKHDICSACLHGVFLKELRRLKRKSRRKAALVMQATDGEV